MFKEDEQTSLPKRLSLKQLQKKLQSQKEKGKHKPERSRGKPAPKQPRGMILKNGEKKNVRHKTASSSEDWSSTTSEEMAPSPKRIDVEKTPPQPQPQTSQTEATRKSTRKRQSTLAKGLGNPVPITSIKQKQFSIKSPEETNPKTESTQQLI